jgi:hypothetical protein
MQLSSGEELASIELGFELRGIVPLGTRFLAYGGAWTARGKCAAVIGVETVVKPVTEA